MIWNLLGFDPIRTDVWNLPEVVESENKFTAYYINSPFDVLNEIKDEIVAPRNNAALPPTVDALLSTVFYRAYTESNVNIPDMLAEEQEAIFVDE